MANWIPFHLPFALLGNNQPDQRLLLCLAFLFFSSLIWSRGWHETNMAFPFENWIRKLASSFQKRSTSAALFQFCECHKQFAHKAPNLEAVATLVFCSLSAGRCFGVGGHEGICCSGRDGNGFSEQKGMKRMGEQIHNQEHVCLSLVVLKETQQTMESCK